MTLRHLVIREIIHRRLNSALSAACVAAAAGCLIAAVTVLRATDIRTEHLVAEKEEALEAQMKGMEDSYRIKTKRMVFN